jgi:hypothetical protein
MTVQAAGHAKNEPPDFQEKAVDSMDDERFVEIALTLSRPRKVLMG